MADGKGSIAVVKGRFASQEANVYGLLEVIANLEDKKIRRVGVAAGYENSIYYLAGPTARLSDFQKQLYSNPKGMVVSATNDIQRALDQNLKGQAVRFTELIDKGSTPALTDMIASIIKKTFIRAVDLRLEVAVDRIDLSELEGAEGIFRRGERPRPERESRLDDGEGKVTGIEIELAEDPSGFPVSRLEKGDLILAAITDRRMVATNLARSLKSDQEGRTPMTVELVQRNKMGRIKVITVIKPKVMGVATVATNAKVKLISKAVKTISHPRLNTILSYILAGAAVIAAILAAILFLPR